MRIERLGDLGSAPLVLDLLAAATTRLGLPAPAALIGEWFGSQAIIAPSLQTTEVDADAVFDPTPGGPHPTLGIGGASPIGGGWFGYLSYPDAGADGLGPRIPRAAGGWSDSVLRRDRDGTWWYENLLGAAISPWIVDALQTAPVPRSAVVVWTEADQAAHQRGVLACLEAIAAGEVYQACVCTQFSGRLDGDPIDFFIEAVTRTAPARAAYVAGAWGAVASLSPELFLRRCGEAVTSSPIKGTLPAHADPARLRASVKDVAENIMIVDLVRNDLGRIARTGTVSVRELLAVRPAPGVWHLVSSVSARVAAEMPMTAVLDATFPPASVTGTPKTRARELLTGWEPRRRGVYCGTVGLASPVAGCELNVAIRTVEFTTDRTATLGVGGGITADSVPAREWDECLHKATPIIGHATVGPQSRARRTAS
ncbi:MAG: aminodeoxychorismate synthase component I [Mycolicibacterium sp.]|uniref:aminodeoxychorismate synthase component I n=1 Tax=Mycolicibacterium sp. TaxID=2320850 RepID=UPI003D1515D9